MAFDRSTTNGMKILSAHVDSMKIQKAVDEANLSAGSLEATDEDFRAGREAQQTLFSRQNNCGRTGNRNVLCGENFCCNDEYMKKTNKTINQILI